MPDDKPDFGDRPGDRLTDQVEAAELLDPGFRLRDLVGAEHEAQEIARLDQADQHDVARIGNLVRQQQLAQPRLDLALLAVVDDRIAPG